MYGVISDGVNEAVTVYSPGPVTIQYSSSACTPPTTGDWVITADCTITTAITAPANVAVENQALVTIENGAALVIDFHNHYLKVLPGSGVLIQAGGKVYQQE